MTKPHLVIQGWQRRRHWEDHVVDTLLLIGPGATVGAGVGLMAVGFHWPPLAAFGAGVTAGAFSGLLVRLARR